MNNNQYSDDYHFGNEAIGFVIIYSLYNFNHTCTY